MARVEYGAERRDYVTIHQLDAALANLRAEIGRDLSALTWRIITATIAIAGVAVAAMAALR